MIGTKDSLALMTSGMIVYLLSAIFWTLENSAYMSLSRNGASVLLNTKIINLIVLVSVIMMVIGLVGTIYNLYRQHRSKSSD